MASGIRGGTFPPFLAHPLAALMFLFLLMSVSAVLASAYLGIVSGSLQWPSRSDACSQHCGLNPPEKQTKTHSMGKGWCWFAAVVVATHSSVSAPHTTLPSGQEAALQPDPPPPQHTRVPQAALLVVCCCSIRNIFAQPASPVTALPSRQGGQVEHSCQGVGQTPSTFLSSLYICISVRTTLNPHSKP